MLISFLEQGDTLRALSRSQMYAVESAFTLYLLKAVNFYETFARCDRILDEDQEYLRVPLKEKLAKIITDTDCNRIFKPAIIKLAAGDPTEFQKRQVPIARTMSIIRANRHLVNERVKACVFPISEIGERHLQQLEEKHIKIVESHAKRFAYKNLRFLTDSMGDSDRSLKDITHDLMFFALSTLRQYYPFRKDLHLSNTMRNAITNRGKGYATYQTRDLRQRRFVNSQGVMINRESGGPKFDTAASYVIGDNPKSGKELLAILQKVALQNSVQGIVARFIIDPEAQEKFCVWLEQHVPACVGSSDIAEAVIKSGRDYTVLLAKFLQQPVEDIARALNQIRSVV